MCVFNQFSELALKWHTSHYIGCSECSTGATTVTELTELSSPAGESPCFDFGGAIVQFSISGSIYQSFLDPPSWAELNSAQLTIVTLKIKVIVICWIWNSLFFWKKARTGIERSVLERFLSGGNWNVLQFRMRRRRDGRWGKMDSSKWGRKMEDGIELPLFQVIDQTGRMAASSRWDIQLHYFLILSNSSRLAPGIKFLIHWKYLLHIYWPSNRSDMGSPSNSSGSLWRAGATMESKRWPIHTFLIFLNQCL